MYFEVNITPKEKGAVMHTEPDTKINLLLAPFQPQTRIHIETALNTTAHSYLSLRNPSNRLLNIHVTKKPPSERSVVLSLSKLRVEAGQDVELIISWTAREHGTFRDIIQLTDSRRIKYDIALTTSTTCSKKHGVVEKHTENKQHILDHRKKILTQNAHPTKKSELKKVFNMSENVSNNINSPCNRHKSSGISRYQGKENISTYPVTDWQTPKKSSAGILGHRQDYSLNVSTAKPRDFSMLIESDVFALTPHPWFKNDTNKSENTALENSESSPNSEMHELRRQTYVTAPLFKHSTHMNEDDRDGFEDSLSPQEARSNPNSDFSLLLNDINFTSNTPLTKTAENFQFITAANNKNDTFEIAKGLDIEESLHVPLDKFPEQSASSLLVPTRLSRTFATLSPVMPVVEPGMSKYATSSSPIWSNEKQDFSSNLRAKWESFNLSTTQSDIGAVQEVLGADLWAKPVNQYSVLIAKSGPTSLESIREESLNLTSTTNKTYVKSSNDYLTPNISTTGANCRFDFSPPTNNLVKKTSPIRKIPSRKSSKISKEKSIQEIQHLKKKVAMNTSLKCSGKVSIPGVRITKLSLAGVSRKRINSGLNRVFEPELSMKLHDPDDFFTTLCNPDPFAATTTEDPFLAVTLYYDDKWVKNQELEFKKWLNMLLTPPEHLTSNVDTPLVDVAKIWQTCRSKEDVSLAETKEALSARYHTNQRLNTLRRAACTLLCSNEVVSVLSKVTVCVEKGILVIRQDRDLHKDIGLQKLILELLLCYNPLWLRISLEAIYGETIPLNSNNDIIRLSKFLLTRFFADPHIVKTHSHPTVLNLRLPTFFTVMNKFMLKKFLFIIYFLDYAKTHKLIGHDPCLFHKQSAYKESKKILLRFSQELLSGVGDVTRVLKPYGYILVHKQTELDEYSYAVDNLSHDLRDGVRLCRIMELITGKRNLTAVCRVPAISRLQKVYNVDVALKALTSSGYNICGNITAKCIADGHREKTLSLLWQIIYKFQAPHFNKAAVIIQKWWRATLWWVRIKNFLLKRKHNAAWVIQRAWRSYLAKRQLKYLREKRVLILSLQNKAATVIQLKWIATVQMWKQKKQFKQMKLSAVKLQKFWRNYRATNLFVVAFKQKQTACRIIQQHWRATQLMRLQVSTYLILKDAVTKIQRWWKIKLIEKTAYNHYQAIKKATLLVQRKWRSNRLMKIEREKYKKKVISIKTIQGWWIRELAYRKDRRNFLLMKGAVLLIEKWWLQCSVKGKLQALLKKEMNAVITLQQRWRAIQLCRLQRNAFVSLKKSVVTVQRRWRAIRTAKSVQQSYILKRKAAIVIQSYWRNWRVGFQVRYYFLSLKAATVSLQSRFRANKAASQTADNFNKLKQSTVIIQRKWRATLLKRQIRQEFLYKRNAAIMIQKRYRMVVAQRKYQAKKQSVIKIQFWWKACIATKQAKSYYNLLKSTTILLQHKYKARKLGGPVRKNFLTLKINVTFIQQKWRAKKLMEPHRENFMKKRQAVNKIQLWWRACLIANDAKLSYELLKSKTVYIQRQYRAHKLGNLTRKQFLTLKRNVIYIQQNWKAKKLTQIQRQNFLAKQWAAVKIQSWWRTCLTAKQAKMHYDLLKSTTVLVQHKYRALKIGSSIRKQFKILRYSVVYIQQKWRANKLMRLHRHDFVAKRQAVVKIQGWWRAVTARRICQESYKTQRIAAIQLQRWYRSTMYIRLVKEKYKKILQSTKIIQAWWRDILRKRQIVRQREITSAVKIQAIWRGHKLRQSQSQEMVKLRERSKKARMEAQPSATLGYRLNVAIDVVQGYENLGKLTQGLTALDTITYLMPGGCKALCDANLIPMLYNLLHRSNRSRPWMDICLRASSILVSIAKYERTKSYAWQEDHIETIIRLLSATIERETNVFLTLATLLWLLADTPERVKAIAESPLIVRSFSAMHNTVSKKKSRLSLGPKLPHLSCVLPNSKPDWGLKHGRPRLFTSVHHAVLILCKKFKLKLT
ncbi:protein abnormal spindle isoform X1 [Neodiprion lecontei]|uniref:Protein abnormal spindle isoform X1 n=1 Tax=Neodiprion lecontei TaxID=441921 RepID=A0A6J0C732_NEOLC|nr:protein abnormal spindle isoform X1 [Neodiprion lecontei]